MRRVLPLALLLALAGCGVREAPGDAEAVVDRFLVAVERDDGAGACAELSTAAIAQLESQSGQDCEAVVTRLQIDPGPVTRTRVFGTGAIAQLGTGELAFLSREPAGWRLSAVGCTPQGDPTERPADCEVQA